MAFIAQRLPFDHATIIPGEVSLGACIHPDVRGYNIPRTRPSRRALARQLMIVAYAGIPAQVIVDPSPEKFHGSTDEDNAFELSREYQVLPNDCRWVGDEAHVALFEKRRTQAKRLLQRNRRAVCELADALLKEHRMTDERA